MALPTQDILVLGGFYKNLKRRGFSLKMMQQEWAEDTSFLFVLFE